MSKAIAELSADAAVLISEFSRKEKGDIITYEQIAQWIGWDIRENRSVMTTVKRNLIRDHGLVLGTVFGEGFRVLQDDEVSGDMRRDRERRRRNAIRSKRKASTVDFAKLNEAQRIAIVGETTIAHLTAEASRDASVKKLDSQINGATTPLALNKALEALKRNI